MTSWARCEALKRKALTSQINIRERSHSADSHRQIHHLLQHPPVQRHHPAQIQASHECPRRAHKPQKSSGRYDVGTDERYGDSRPELAVEREGEPGLGDLRRTRIVSTDSARPKGDSVLDQPSQATEFPPLPPSTSSAPRRLSSSHLALSLPAPPRQSRPAFQGS